MKKKVDFEFVSVDSLIPYDRNARKHSAEQVAKVAASRVREKIGNIFDQNIIEKCKQYKIDFSSCYHSCVMAGNNAYLESLKKGIHKEFV